jgi:hypothetical protein
MDSREAEHRAAADAVGCAAVAAELCNVRRGYGKEVTRNAFAPRALGFALLLPALFLLCLWLYEFNRHDVQERRVAAFLAHFPEALRDLPTLTGVSILSSGLATVFLGVAFSRSTGIWRFLTLFGLVVAVLLLLLNGWQLL